MSGTRIARLTVRAGWAEAARTGRWAQAAFAGVAVPRLLVVRRIGLGRAPPGGRGLDRRAALALADADAAAVHGSRAGATAPAVWFADEAEALVLLLEQLAAGRRPDAWFWRLAVPGWTGAAVAEAAPALAGTLLRRAGGELALARLLRRLAGTPGSLVRLALALAPAVRSAPVSRPAPPDRPARAGEAPDVAEAVPGEAARAEASAARVERLWAALPSSVRVGLCEVLRVLPEGAPRRLVAWAVIAAEAPALLAAPAPLWRWADALVVLVLAAPDPLLPVPVAAQPRSADSPASGELRPPPTRLKSVAPGARAEAAVPPEPVGSVAGLERPSAVAGTLLAIGALDRMGLGAWLAARPGLLADGFARALLRAIAVRRLRGTADALPSLLAGPEALPDALDAWRVGLDRWLRRRAGARLAELTGLRGTLEAGEDGLVARFRPVQADIRLRRLALDVDPGWTPWLGLSVRYRFDG